MHSFRLLCIGMAIVMVHSAIPYNQIDFQLLEYFPRSFEEQIWHSLQATKFFFSRNDIEATMAKVAKPLTFVPYLRPLKSSLTVLKTILSPDSELKETLYRTVADIAHRSAAEKDIIAMETSVRTINQHISDLNPHKNLTYEIKTVIVQNIHENLLSMITKFSQRHSVFRKYPLIGMPILLAMSPFVSLFVPIECALIPEFSQGSVLSCRLYRTLFDYRTLAAESRLFKLDIADSTGAVLQKRNPIHNIISKEYNEWGYNQTSDPKIMCRRGCRESDGDQVYICLRDPISRTEYDCNKRHEMYACVFSYMEFVRHRVESAFIDPIKMVARTCTDDTWTQPARPLPTGYGWWTIMFHSAEAYTDLYGKDCDEFAACDAYIKVFIDGREVFRTDYRLNNNMPYFGETYRSPRIHKQAHITIEMWDEDSGWMESTDDLMMRWETNVEDLIRNGIKWGAKQRNKIVTTSSWKDEFPDSYLQYLIAI